MQDPHDPEVDYRLRPKKQRTPRQQAQFITSRRQEWLFWRDMATRARPGSFVHRSATEWAERINAKWGPFHDP